MGAFSFEAMPLVGGAAGTMKITSGKFDVAYTTSSSRPAAGAAGKTPTPRATPAPPASGQTASTGAMSAEINSKAWSSSFQLYVTYNKNNNGLFQITGFDSDASGITIGVGQVTGPGTYSLAFLNPKAASAMVGNSSSQVWNSYAQGGTGTITFTTLTDHRAVGTFSFEAMPSVGGATGTMKVTNGKFDVTY
ncbi:MAG: hypothetical protein FJ316_04395 [SAR202 cluster bacterium]|nr:hypothetical protein [SAR202 cluster bacterium]